VTTETLEIREKESHFRSSGFRVFSVFRG
jgi:hypothetical protein